MAEEEMTLDLFDQQITNYKIEDLQKKVDIAANIIKQCSQNSDNKVCSPLTKCSVLTGVSKETLIIIKALERKTKKFEQWCDEHQKSQYSYSFTYKNLRRQLIEEYIKQRKIPTNLNTKGFVNYKTFFTSIQLPGTSSSIIVEKPETVFERQRYLYKKMKYREENKNIVYIGKVSIIFRQGKFSYKEDNTDIKSRFIIAVSPTFGYMAYIYCCGYTQEYLTNWMEEKIIPELPAESVIIFQENVLGHCTDEDVNSHSSKQEMLIWLESKKIPHEPTMHRADLYKLINEYRLTSIGQSTSAEDCLRAVGHSTLRKKQCNLGFNYFDPFWEFLTHELNTKPRPEVRIPSMKNYSYFITQTANVIVQNSPLEYWTSLGEILRKKEEEIYKEDLEMEYIIDQLMTMAKHEGLPKEGDMFYTKFDEYDKTAEREYIFDAGKMTKFFEYMRNDRNKRKEMFMKKTPVSKSDTMTTPAPSINIPLGSILGNFLGADKTT